MSDMNETGFQQALARGDDEPGLRQAAALIHALAPQDRRWAIAQLPEGSRGAVEALLAELAALGLPRDRTLVEEALQTTGDEPVRAVAPSEAQAVEDWVAAHGVTTLARLLAPEPAALIARILGLHEWSWRAELLRQLQPAQRRDVVEAMRDDGSVVVVGGGDALVLSLLARRVEMQTRTTTAAKPARARPVSSATRPGLLIRWLSKWRTGAAVNAGDSGSAGSAR